MFKNFFPNKILSLTNKTINILTILLIVVVVIGLIYSLFLSPPDYIQGDSVRIMYVHVPSSFIALGGPWTPRTVRPSWRRGLLRATCQKRDRGSCSSLPMIFPWGFSRRITRIARNTYPASKTVSRPLGYWPKPTRSERRSSSRIPRFSNGDSMRRIPAWFR